MKLVSNSIYEKKEEGLGVEFDAPTRYCFISNVDVTQPMVISITWDTAGTSKQACTLDNLNVLYQSIDGVSEEGEATSFVIGTPVDTTVGVYFPSGSTFAKPVTGIVAAYQAIIQ